MLRDRTVAFLCLVLTVLVWSTPITFFDTEFEGEAKPQSGINIGYLPQEPKLDESKTVLEVVEEAVADVKHALTRYILIISLFNLFLFFNGYNKISINRIRFVKI